MMGKMVDPNIIDYYIINCAIPSIITIQNRYQIDLGKPAHGVLTLHIQQHDFTSCGDINLLSCCSSHLLLLNRTATHIIFFQFLIIKMLLQVQPALFWMVVYCTGQQYSFSSFLLQKSVSFYCCLWSIDLCKEPEGSTSEMTKQNF